VDVWLRILAVVCGSRRETTIGRKCSDTFRDVKDRFIRHDDVRGQWNYLIDANGLT